ncbi:MAG: hypothetical protein NTV03_03775 [Candidatus Nomurabacteria bacterium]|nr:hypothetical protein [Candidatus Nomurabacteria bacterium]
MSIKRIKYSVVFIVMFFSCVNLAHAGLEITEIMYDLDGTDIDWVEIYNPDSSDVDVTKIKLLVGDSTESNHGISSYSNSQYLHKGEYGIIVSKSQISSFISKWGSSIIIFSSSDFSLPNLSKGGEGTVSINNGDKNSPLDSVTYTTSDGANGNGNSLSGDLEELTPTPGTANSSNNNPSDNSLDNSTDNPVDEIVDPISVKNNTPVIYKIVTKIIAPKIVTAGVPFSIDHSTTGLNKEKIILGKFVWNFGDGMQKQLSLSDPFSYVYDYPGEYVLTLSYSDSIFDTKPDATDRLTIKVIPSGVSISSVGTYTDPFVEIENNSSYEMSLNKWILKGSVHSFLIPEGMVILPNKKLKFSPKITGFDFNDLSSISIIDTSGQVFATYPKQKTYSTKNYSASNSQGNIVKADIVASDQASSISNSPDVINLNDLGASAGSVENELNNKTLIYLGLAGIIAIGLLCIFLIRRKNEIPDYVEKGISASDMTIIE